MTSQQKNGLLSLVSILKVSESTTIEFEGNQVTHRDLCFKTSDAMGVSYCYVPSVLDLFYDRDFINDSPPNFLDTVKAKIDTLTDSEIKAILSIPTNYKSWNGGALLQGNILGKVSGTDNNFKAEAFFVELLLNSTPLETEGKIEDLRAMTWEREWIKTFTGGTTIDGAESAAVDMGKGSVVGVVLGNDAIMATQSL